MTGSNVGARLRGQKAACGVFIASLLVSGCSAAAESAVASPTVGPTPSPTSIPTATPNPSLVIVSARSNIFGAGHEQPPAPGGGGAGQLPPMWPLPPGSTRLVSFPRVAGLVNGISGQVEDNGPEGRLADETDVESLEGISGIIDGTNTMFLVGVFLTDEEPADPAPPRLDFTDGEQFTTLAPEIGQTFFIGDGVGRSYQVPPGATRLFLGIADAFFWKGPPGFYANNSGELEVTVDVAVQ